LNREAITVERASAWASENVRRRQLCVAKTLLMFEINCRSRKINLRAVKPESVDIHTWIGYR
jgi:hypothetical protein